MYRAQPPCPVSAGWETGGVGVSGTSASFSEPADPHKRVVPPSSSASAKHSREATYKAPKSSRLSDSIGHHTEATPREAAYSRISELGEGLQREGIYRTPGLSSEPGGFRSKVMLDVAQPSGGSYQPASLSVRNQSNDVQSWDSKPGVSEWVRRYPGEFSGASCPWLGSFGPQPGGGMHETPSVPESVHATSSHAYVNRVFYMAYPDEEGSNRNIANTTPGGTDVKGKRTRIRWRPLLVAIFAFLLAAGSVAGIIYYTTKEKDKASTSPALQKDHPTVLTHSPGEMKGSFKVMAKWDPALSDTRGDAFKRTASKLAHMIDSIFKASNISDLVKKNFVTSLREGSVIVNFLTLFETADISHVSQQLLSFVKAAFLEGHNAVLSKHEHLDTDEILVDPALIVQSSVIFQLVPLSSTSPPASASTTRPTTTPMTSTTATTTSTTTTTMTTTTNTPSTTPSSEQATTTSATSSSVANSTSGLRVGASEGDEEETTTEASAESPPCGIVRTPPTARIIGGTVAQKGVYPWVVLLGEDDHFFCGGSIIDPLHIITAAHCLEDYSPSDGLHVIAGSQVINYQTVDNFQDVNVSAFYVHKDFNIETPGHWNSFLNDIAVLKLVKPLTFNSRVSAVCLPQTNSTLPTPCTAAGWGSTTSPRSTFPNELHVVTLDTYNRSRCEQVFADSFRTLMVGDDIKHYLNDGVMCAANGTSGGLDTCYGDSGGALFCLQDDDDHGQRYTQFGVVSWGEGCALPGSPGFYAYVPHFRTWLDTEAIPALDKNSGS